jgi:hypothetical protein
VQAEVARSFGDQGRDSDDYRLVALPGTVDRDVGDVLSGKPGVAWTVFWDNGTEDDFLVEYDGSDAFHFRPGRGFWAVSKSELTLAESFSTVSLQADTAVTVPLHSGWNIISNPFGRDVAWSAVDAAHAAALQPIFGFTGTFSERDTLASSDSGVAYYFLNDQGLDELTIPYPGAPQSASSSSSGQVASKAAGAGLTVTATPVGESPSDVRSTIRVRSGATGSAPGRHVAPPRRFEAVSLRIRDEAAASPRRRFLAAATRDLRTGQTLPLVLRATDATSVHLRARRENLGDKRVVLLDPRRGTSYELRDGDGATVDVREEQTRLKLAVGSERYVDEKQQAVAPEEVTLTSAPNPFRRRATIRYAVPEDARVQFDVYDVLGRRVATLVDGRKEAGRYRVQFSASDLSSGVYFGRLEVDGQVLTRKLTVVR